MSRESLPGEGQQIGAGKISQKKGGPEAAR
jgi:hypothetical protein